MVTWMINLLCCAVGQLSPVGKNCWLLPRLEGLLTSHTGPWSVSLVPLRLNELNKCLVDVSVRVMGGSDVHTLLNHLQARMKVFVKDRNLLACPKLLQVRMSCFLGFQSLFSLDECIGFFTCVGSIREIYVWCLLCTTGFAFFSQFWRAK